MKTYLDGTLIEEWDDVTRTHTNHETSETRPYTDTENEAADQAAQDDARLDDFETRIAALEAAMWPAQPDPTSPDGVKDWAAWDGVVPNGQLLLDMDGVVYRNVAGVPLTTPPSQMPGSVTQWTHLWTPALTATQTAPYDPFTVYKIGDRVTFEGSVWESVIANNSWSPTGYPAGWRKV